MKRNKKQETKRTNVAVKHMTAYVHLFKVAELSLERVEKGEDNFFYDSMSCILFCALSLEAYLNHVGATEFQFWEEGLERLNPSAKLKLIASERLQVEKITLSGFPQKRNPIKISIDFSRRPFQSFKIIFEIRSQLAHGKTSWLIETMPNKPEAKWEKYCTPQHAKRFLKDTEEIIKFIHSNLYETTQNPFTPDLKFFGIVETSSK